MSTTVNLPRFAPLPKGIYSGATEYQLLDLVTDQGSTWIYINATASTGNAPPTLPTTSNSHWALTGEGAPSLSADESLLTRRSSTAFELVKGANGRALFVNSSGVLEWQEFVEPPELRVSALPAYRHTGTGDAVSLAINGAGRVVAAGVADHLLGGGNLVTRDRLKTIPVDGASGDPTIPFTKVVCGNQTGCALDSAGAVWCWGTNASGSVGDGTTTARPFMYKVAGDLSGKVVTDIFWGRRIVLRPRTHFSQLRTPRTLTARDRSMPGDVTKTDSAPTGRRTMSRRRSALAR